MTTRKPIYLSTVFREATPQGTYLVRSNTGSLGYVEPYPGQPTPELGDRLQAVIFGYNGNGHGPTTFFGAVRPPRELQKKMGVVGADINCVVVGRKNGGALLRAYGSALQSGTAMYGSLDNVSDEIKDGDHLQVRVTGVKKEKGVPVSFSGEMVRLLKTGTKDSTAV